MCDKKLNNATCTGVQNAQVCVCVCVVRLISEHWDRFSLEADDDRMKFL